MLERKMLKEQLAAGLVFVVERKMPKRLATRPLAAVVTFRTVVQGARLNRLR